MPGPTNNLISDRAATVQLMLGNRNDLASRLPVWIANAYIELASNIPFPDLEASDYLLTTAGGGFPPVGDSYAYPTNARGILSATMFINNIPRPIKKKNIEYIDFYPTIAPGPPAVWAPFNYQMIFRPVPDQAYTILRRFWTSPVVDFSSTGATSATQLMIPFDWFEVVDYMAALRGYMELQNTQKVAETRQILYGDPKHPQDNPGLIKQHLTPIQSENMNSDYGMRMKVRRYTGGL